MSFMSQIKLNPFANAMRDWRQLRGLTQIQISTSQKVVLVSISAGVAILAVLAQYLKRRRKTPSSTNVKSKRTKQQIQNTPQRITSPNGGSRRSGSPSLRTLNRQPSILSTLSDRISSVSGLPPDTSVQLTPQQLGVMGMEALETSINCWEDALAAYQGGGGEALCLTDEEEAQFAREIQDLLEAAYRLQRKCELLFLDQRSVLFRTDSSARGTDSGHRDCYSSAESFVSAQDEIADLREFEEFADLMTDVEKLPLYQSAMKHFEEHGIPYRCLRTEIVHCSSDLEYLVKLHCVRLAFQWTFQNPETWTWFADFGRQILTDLLLYADKDPKDLMIAYEEMLEFLKDNSSWPDIEAELSLKGVKALTFYDVVLDYILMDAFEDLDAPPSSVTAVVQNRWLSKGFKESALTTAVWSVLKAKRRMLAYPNGFMAHFYSISEQMSPLMAWGFLGPDEHLKEICQYFKDQVMGFLTDIFSFQSSRFTTVDELAEDVMKHVKTRIDNVCVKLTKQLEAA